MSILMLLVGIIAGMIIGVVFGFRVGREYEVKQLQDELDMLNSLTDDEITELTRSINNYYNDRSYNDCCGYCKHESCHCCKEDDEEGE